MEVAAYTPADAAALAELMHAAIRAAEVYRPAQRAAWSPAPQPVTQLHGRLAGAWTFVARDAAGPAGFMATGPDGHVDLAFVHPRAQGLGVASALLEATVAAARGARLARLFTEASEAARPFFAARGFVARRSQVVQRRGVALSRWVMDRRLRSTDPARRVVVVGPSGSGKSTFAAALAAAEGRLHVDLDRVAFADQQGTRRPVEASLERLRAEREDPRVVFEGCYADLAQALAGPEDHLVWLDLPVERCLEHARARPWEPHKWPSKAEQDAFLPHLEAFIRSYPDDPSPTGRAAHATLFETFPGARERHPEPPHPAE